MLVALALLAAQLSIDADQFILRGEDDGCDGTEVCGVDCGVAVTLPAGMTAANLSVGTCGLPRFGVSSPCLLVTGTWVMLDTAQQLARLEANTIVDGELHAANTLFVYSDGAGAAVQGYSGPGPDLANGNGDPDVMTWAIDGNGAFLATDGTDDYPGLGFFDAVHTVSPNLPPTQYPTGDGFRRIAPGHLGVSLEGDRHWEIGKTFFKALAVGVDLLGFRSIKSQDLETGSNAVRFRNTSGVEDARVSLLPGAGGCLVAGADLSSGGFCATKGSAGTWQTRTAVTSGSTISGYESCGSGYCRIHNGAGLRASKAQDAQCISPGAVTIDLKSPTVRLATNTWLCTATLSTTSLAAFVNGAGSLASGLDSDEVTIVVGDETGAGGVAFAGADLLDPGDCVLTERGHSMTVRYMRSMSALVVTSCSNGGS